MTTNTASERAAKSTDALAPMPKLRREILTCDIDPDPDQPRQEFIDHLMDELEASVRAGGVQEDIKVRKHPTDPTRYMLVDGERRWRTATKLRIQKMWALVVTGTPDQIFMHAATSNFARAGHTPVESAHVLKRMMEILQCNEVVAAERLGKGPYWAKKHKWLLEINPRILDFMKPPVPLKDRLALNVAILVRPLEGWGLQYQMAEQFFKNKTSEVSAKKIIEDMLTRQGKPIPKKSASHKRQSILSLIKGSGEKAAELATMPETAIIELFKDKASYLGREAVPFLDKLIADLKALRDKLGKIQ